MLRRILIFLLILVSVPFYTLAQCTLSDVQYFVNLNDSGFSKDIFEATVSSAKAGTADLNVVFTQWNDTVAVCELNKLNIKAKFTNLKISAEALEFKSKQLKGFFEATGHLPAGNYTMTAVLRNDFTKPIIKVIKAESDFSYRIATSEKSTRTAKKSSMRLSWNLNGPNSLKQSISYHLAIARVSDYWDSRRPLTRLREYQWVPDLKSDSVSVKDLPVRLKPNKVYTYYIEAYINNTRIGISPRKVFLNKTLSSNNPISKIFHSIFPANKFGNLEALVPDTGKASANKLHGNPLNKYQKNNSTSPVQFYGSARIETQVSDLSAPNTQIPPNYANFYLNPGVQVYNLPVVSNIFLTTENSSVYRMNSFSIDFDLQKYRENQLNAFKLQNLDMGNLTQFSQSGLKSLQSQKELLTQQISELEANINKQESTELSSSHTSPNMTGAALKGNLPIDSLHKDSTQKPVSNPGKHGMDSSAKVRKNITKDETSLQDSMLKAKKAGSRFTGKTDSLQRLNPGNSSSIVNNNKSLDSSKAQLSLLKQRLAIAESALQRFQQQANGFKSPSEKDIFADMEKFMPGNHVLNKIVTVVDRFNIGKTYPVFSDLSLSGTAVNGCNLGLSNKYLYTQIVAGNSLTYNPDLTQSKDFITGIKAGIGNETTNHIALSFVNVAPNGAGGYLKDQVLSGELQYVLLKNLIFTGNINKSFVSGGTPDQLPLGNKLMGINDIFVGDQNAAYSVKAQYSNPALKSKLLVSYSVIESNYISVAAPFIRPGTTEYNISYDQSLFKRTVTLSAFYRSYTDSLSKLSNAATMFSTYGLTGNIGIKHLPILSFSISPYKQSTTSKADSLGTNNTTNSIMGNVSLSYPLKIKGMVLNTVANCTKMATQNTVLKFAYQSSNYTFSEQLTLKSGTYFNIAATIINAPGTENSFIDYHAGIGGTIRHKWNNSITADFNVSDSTNMYKYTFCWQSSLNVNKQLSIQFRVGENFINNIEQQGFSRQYFLNTSLLFSFK